MPDCLPWQFWLGYADLLAATAPHGLSDGLVATPASPAPFQASQSSVPAISLLSMMAYAIVKTGDKVVRLDFFFFSPTRCVSRFCFLFALACVPIVRAPKSWVCESIGRSGRSMLAQTLSPLPSPAKVDRSEPWAVIPYPWIDFRPLVRFHLPALRSKAWGRLCRRMLKECCKDQSLLALGRRYRLFVYGLLSIRFCNTLFLQLFMH